MAAYLELTRKTDGKVYNGSRLIDLDTEIAAHLGIEPDPVEWTLGWMNGPGLYLAVGKTFAQVREIFTGNIDAEPACEALLDYLEANFTNTSFISR
jgi:hypothetical protein